MQHHRGYAVLLALLLAQLPAAASAQTHQPSPPTAQAPSKPACPPDVGPNAPTVGSGDRTGNLSDQLAQSGGIICPPAATDNDMALPPKETGRMPVIPPPGTPGGDQHIQPK